LHQYCGRLQTGAECRCTPINCCSRHLAQVTCDVSNHSK
jgi:hypothetical protein